MRKIFFLSLFTLLSISLQAQDFKGGYGQTDQLVTDFFRQVKTKDSRNVTVGSIKGSPYFEEEFERGTLLYNDEPQEDIVFMRYNAFADEIEMTPHQFMYKTDQAVVKSTDLSCIIGDDKYVYLPFVDKASGIVKMGYMIEVYKGKKFRVYFNKTKVYMEATQARTGLERSFPARFVDDQTYYFNTKGDTPKELKLYKSKLRELFENKDRFNSFIRSNRRPKNNTDQWLTELFKYMEQ
jgi:hypothetical protein